MTTEARAARPPIVLLRLHWRRLAITLGVALAVAIAYALLAPPWYKATITVLPSPQAKGVSPLLGGGGGASSALAAIDLPFDLGMGGSDVERIAAVMRSESVTDAVIAKFGLMARYDAKYIEDARKELWEHCGIGVEKKPALVFVQCEDRSPEVAQSMTAFFGEHGNLVFRRVSASSASEERRFLEKRVAEARNDAWEAAARLRDFQEKNKVVNLIEQSKAVVGALATVRNELMAKQMQLSYLDGFSARDEASANQYQRQVTILENKLESLEGRWTPRNPAASSQPASAPQPAPKKAARRGKASGADGPGVFPVAVEVPKLQFEFERLVRELKVQEALFLMLTQRYEAARVSEARDTSTFQVLDSPTVPTKRARPKRPLIVLAGFFLGLVLGLAWILGPLWWRAVLAAPETGAPAATASTQPPTGTDGKAT